MINNHALAHVAFTPSVKIVFTNGETVNVANTGIGLQNSSFADSSESNTLPVGTAIGKTLTLELLNDNGQWNGYDFFGASVTLTLTYDTGDQITYKGWTVTEPPKALDTYITITCLDEMWRADKPYTSSLVYPASIGAIWREACTACGLNAATLTDGVFSDTVSEPLPSTYTYRQVFAFIAGIAGGNCRIRHDGKLEIKKWSIPTSSSSASSVHVLDDWITLTPALHSITITGVSMPLQNAGDSQQTLSVGTDDYMIQIAYNPLITADTASRYLGNILSCVGGVPIHPYSGNYYFLPTIEFGDAAAVVTYAGDTLYSVVTGVSWPLGGRTALKCSLEAPLIAGRQYVDPSLQALIAAKQLIAKERTEREQAIISLQTALAGASGLYSTQVAQQGGGTIYYLHDRPTLATSTNIMKLTSDVIAFSTDGGATYPYGFQLDGNMVVRILSASGISADWINTGALVVRDDDGNVLFSADVDNGTVFIDGISVDNGVVTVGQHGAPYYTQVTENGLSVYAKGQLAATLGVMESRLPHATIVPAAGYLSVGIYRIYAIGNEIAIGI